MKLYELQAGAMGKDLDSQLKGVASGMDDANNQPEMPDEQNNQQDMYAQNQGQMSDPSKQNPATGTEDNKPKKVDPVLLASVKSMPYVTDYNWNDESKVSPYRLLQLSKDDLISARNLFRAKIGQETLSDQYGTWADPSIKYYQDAINFIEKIITSKKDE